MRKKKEPLCKGRRRKEDRTICDLWSKGGVPITKLLPLSNNWGYPLDEEYNSKGEIHCWTCCNRVKKGKYKVGEVDGCFMCIDPLIENATKITVGCGHFISKRIFNKYKTLEAMENL